MKKQTYLQKLLPWKWSYLLALLLALAIALAPGAALAADGAEDASAPVAPPSLFWSDDLSFVKFMVRNNAFYDVDEQVFNAKDAPSLIAALKKYDKWAEYYSAEEFKAFVAEIEGE